MADEEIIIKYVVMADDAIEQAKRMAEAVERSKVAIRSLAAEAKTSFKDAGDVLKNAIKGLNFGDIGASKKLSDLLGIDEATINNETKFAQARTQAMNTITKAVTALGQEERAQINSTKQAWQEYVQVTNAGRGTMSEAAKAIGKDIGTLKTQIVSGAVAQKQSYQEVADSMVQAGADSKQVNQAIKELAQAEKAQADLRKKSLDEQKAAQKDYEQVTTKGYGNMTAAGVQFGQAVEGLKAQIVAQSQSTGQTYEEVADAMAKAGTNTLALDTAVKQANQSMTERAQKEKASIAELKKVHQEYAQITNQGYGTMSEAAQQYGRIIQSIKSQIINGQTYQGESYEAVAERMRQAQVDATMLNQALKEIRQEEAAQASLNKKNLKDQADAQKEYEQVTTKGFGTMSQAATVFGQAVQGIKAQIIAQAQTSGQTYQEIAEQMKTAGTNAYALNTALKEIDKEEKIAAQQAKQDRAAEAAAMREYVQVTKQGYGVMSAAAQQFGQAVQATKQQIVTTAQAQGVPYQQIAQQMVNAGANINVVNTAMKQINATINQTSKSASTLGATLQQAFAIGLGLNIYNAIQQLLSLFKEAMQSAFDLAKSYFQLEVGIRAVRRAGMDIATPEMLANLDRLREKFGMFSKKELVEGSAALINLIRDMGMTKDQVFELQDAIATLAVVNGRSMDEVQRTVALALSSGYTEGLQRLGVSINRVNIAARANAMGWKGGYTALTEHQRAMATLSLIMEKTAKYSDDLTEYQKTEAGQVETLTAKVKDLKAALGKDLVGAQVAYNQVLVEFLEILSRVLDEITPLIRMFTLLNDISKDSKKWFEDLLGPLKWVVDGYTKLNSAVSILTHPLKLIGELTKGTTENFQRMKDSQKGFWSQEFLDKWGWLSDILEKIYGLKGKIIELPEVPVGTPDLTGGEAENATETKGKDMMDYVMELHHDIEKEQLRFNQRMKELEIDLARDLEKIEIERDRDLRDLYEDYIQDKLDIAEEGAKKVAEAEAEYARKVIDVNRDYNNKVAEANRKYQNDQIDAEKKFQEEMRKLREEFIFDLEGALEERDARAVLNLIRRYNLDRSQAERGFALDQEERARQHQLEMEELARERDERLRQLAEEHALKIAQIQAETAERLAKRQEEYEREKADRIQKAEEDKQDRRNQFNDQMDDLKLQFQQRMEELAFELSSEKNMTADLLAQIAAEYAKTYGPGGAIDQYLSYYIGLLAARAAQAASIMSQLQSYSKFYYPTYSMNTQGTDPGGSNIYYRAEGGIMYADKPTHVVFGEAGLERAEFTPISRSGKNTGKVVSGEDYLAGSGSEGAKGSVAIRVSLSPELIGQIEENTLNQAAEVLLEVQRRVR